MQYDEQPRRSGGNAGILIVLAIVAAGLLVVVLGVAAVGYLMFAKASSASEAAMAEAMAMEAEQRAAADAALKHAAHGLQAPPPGGQAGDSAQRIAELEVQLQALQARLDRRMAEDAEMVNALRQELEMTRTQLEAAQRKLAGK